MNVPKDWVEWQPIPNFAEPARDKFLWEMMRKYGVDGRYVTDIVKTRDVPRSQVIGKINVPMRVVPTPSEDSIFAVQIYVAATIDDGIRLGRHSFSGRSTSMPISS
jgi:hypothetical protein